MRIWFDVITWSDAKALKRWWNQHTLHTHHIVPSKTNPRFFALMRSLTPWPFTKTPTS